MLDQDRTYMPKPLVSDSIPALYGLSGSYVNSKHNTGDIQNLFELNVTGAHVLKKIQVSYAGHLFWGEYFNESINEGDSYYFRVKKFGGYGLRGSINLVQSDGRFEFRVPGIEFSWSQENGEYAKFRRSLLNQTVHYTNPKTSLFTAGISNELAWKSNIHPDVRYAFKIFFGRNFGDMSFYNANSSLDWPKSTAVRLTMDTSFLFSLKQFYMVGSLTRFSSLKLTMGYAFGKQKTKTK